MTPDVVDRLFVRLEAIYTARWRMSAATPGVAKAMKEAWCEAMAGIDTRRVKGALSKLHLATDGWPPTPGQFRAMCRPTASDLGLPDRETAWQQAVGNAKITHPVVWHVREKLGAWKLKSMPQATTRPRFDHEWALAVEQEAASRAAAKGPAFRWSKGTDPAGALEDTRGTRGRRGPTAASKLALKAVREKWNRAPAEEKHDAPLTTATPQHPPPAEAALKEVSERLAGQPIEADPALQAVSVEPFTGESDLAEYMSAWDRAPDAAKGAAACDLPEEIKPEAAQNRRNGVDQGHPTGSPEKAAHGA